MFSRLSVTEADDAVTVAPDDTVAAAVAAMDDEMLSQYVEDNDKDHGGECESNRVLKECQQQAEEVVLRDKRTEELRWSEQSTKRKSTTSSEPEWDTPSKFTNPDITFHPRFDFTAGKSYMDELAAKRKKTADVESPSVTVERCLARAVETTSRAEAFFRSPVVDKNVAVDDFEDMDVDAIFEPPRTSAISTPVRTGPLVGVTVCFGKKHCGEQERLNDVVKKLGGSYRWNFDPSCTHFVFKGRSNDQTKDYRTAKEMGKFIVHPEWLQACLEQNKRVDETLYPHTYQPSKGVVASAKKINPTSSKLSQPKTVTRSTSVKTPASGGKNKKAARVVEEPVEQTPKFSEAVSTSAAVEFSNDSKTTAASGCKDRLNFRKQLAHVLSRSKMSASDDDETKSNRSPSSGSSNSRANANDEVPADRKQTSKASATGALQAADSQGFKVEWDDPNQKQQRKDIQPLLKPISEPTQLLGFGAGQNPLADLLDDDEDVQMLNAESSSSSTKHYRFMITSIDDERRRKSCVDIIESLGGEYYDKRNFTPECTHLIVDKPTRNEKLLASIATGKWILHSSFLDACKKVGCFIEETEYEWGSASMARMIPGAHPVMQNLAKSCRRWRLALLNENKKPYAGWKICLLVDKNLENGLRTLLEHGGGVLYPKDTPPSRLTHAFISEKQTNSAYAQRLIRAKVKCYKPDYTAAYLIQENLNEKEFLLTGI